MTAPTAPEKKEFWRWQENFWIDETKDWKTAKIITCGIDVGSVSSQAVVVRRRRTVRLQQHAHRQQFAGFGHQRPGRRAWTSAA